MSQTFSWEEAIGQGAASPPPSPPRTFSWDEAIGSGAQQRLLTPDQFFGASPQQAPAQAGSPRLLTPEEFFGGGAPAKPAAPVSGYGANIAAGAAEGLGDVVNLGFPPVARMVYAGANSLYHGGSVGDAARAAMANGSRTNPQPGILNANTDIDSLAHAGGVTAPGDVQPNGMGQSIARIGARAATSGALFGAPEGVEPALTQAVAGAGLALAGVGAGSLVPDQYKPLASLFGNVMGAAGLLGIRYAVPAAAQAVGGKAAEFARPIFGKASTLTDDAGRPILLSDINPEWANMPVMAKPGVAQMASKVVNSAATDPAAARTALANTSELVPGSAPTSFQATQDPGLGRLEVAAQLKNGPLFAQRGLQQQAARQGFLQSAAGDAEPAAVGQAARSMMENMQAQGEAAVDGLRQQAQAATQNMGGQVPASADGATALQSFGTAMRAPLDAANNAAKANVSRLFDSWDPDGTAQFDMSGVRNGAAQIVQGIGPNAAKPTGEEAAILGRAQMMPSTQSGANFQDFYSRVGDLLRGSRIDPQQAQTYRRMSMLMGYLHGAVEDTVAKAAQADPTVVDRIGSLASGSGGQGAQSLAAGQGYGGLSGAQPEPQSAGGFGGGGTGRQANGGFGGLPGRSSIPTTARAAGKPEGLVSFLTRNGGVYDDGGDLRSMGADKLRVGFLRKPPEGPAGGAQPGFGGGFGGFNSGNSKAGEPMQLDYAREKAIEAGYLPPDSDLTDFKAAIGEDLRGNPQYVPEELANYLAGRPSIDPREEAATDAARSSVLQAVDDMGTDLRGGELEHATRLAVLGVDPMEAVRQAADASRLDYLNGKMFMDDAGMAPHARQANLPVEEVSPAGGAFLTREAADRLAAARAAHKERVETYVKAPGVGAVLARGPTSGTFKMPESAVPSAIWKAGASGADRISAYLRAGGDPHTVQDFAAFDLRKAAEKQDGTLDPGKYQAWAKSHADALSHFPALQTKFESAATARRTMDEASARVVSAQKDFQKSALARFTGDPDPVRTVATILGAKDGAPRMAQLVGQLKNEPAALAGLRHAVMQRYLPLVEGSGFQQFPKALSKEWLAASKVLQPDQLAALRSIAADLKRSGSSISGTRLPGGSDTMNKLAAAAAHGQSGHGAGLQTILLATLLEGGGDVLAHAAGVMGLKGALMAGATTAGGLWANMLRQQGLRSVDDLVALAAAHPPLMRALLAKVPARPTQGALSLLRHQVAASIVSAGAQRATALADPSDDRRSAPPVFPRVSAGRL